MQAAKRQRRAFQVSTTTLLSLGTGMAQLGRTAEALALLSVSKQLSTARRAVWLQSLAPLLHSEESYLANLPLVYVLKQAGFPVNVLHQRYFGVPWERLEVRASDDELVQLRRFAARFGSAGPLAEADFERDLQDISLLEERTLCEATHTHESHFFIVVLRVLDQAVSLDCPPLIALTRQPLQRLCRENANAVLLLTLYYQWILGSALGVYKHGAHSVLVEELRRTGAMHQLSRNIGQLFDDIIEPHFPHLQLMVMERDALLSADAQLLVFLHLMLLRFLIGAEVHELFTTHHPRHPITHDVDFLVDPIILMSAISFFVHAEKTFGTAWTQWRGPHTISVRRLE